MSAPVWTLEPLHMRVTSACPSAPRNAFAISGLLVVKVVSSPAVISIATGSGFGLVMGTIVVPELRHAGCVMFMSSAPIGDIVWSQLMPPGPRPCSNPLYTCEASHVQPLAFTHGQTCFKHLLVH